MTVSSKKRILSNPKSVRISDKTPWFAKRTRATKGAAGAGLYYEKRVADWFTAHFGEDRVIHGAWFAYEDDNGTGWCQPDLLLFPPNNEELVLVGECKLKASKKAEERLQNMYMPLVSILYPNHSVVGVQFCRHLIPRAKDKNQRNLIGYDELIEMEKYDADFYTVNLRRVY